LIVVVSPKEAKMPVGVIKGPESEAIWKRAKEAAQEQYPDLKRKDKNRFYAIVMTIYKNMCTKHNCTPKSESDMSMILNRIELFESYSEESKEKILPKNYVGWQLQEPLSEEEKKITSNAVKDLNNGMRDGMRELKKWMESANIDISKNGISEAGEKLSEVWGKYIKPVIENEKYKSTGINDAEPIYEAGQRLIDFIKEYYGLTGWTSLGDYIN
jgi:hypothetical protein